MQFLTMQQELSDRLKAYDETISFDATKLKRWLNMGQQYIAGKHNWSFMYANETIQTITDYTTGTVATVSGSASVTFNGVISSSQTGYFIKTSSSDDWYQISSHTAGSASAVLNVAAITTAPTATFVIRKLFYSTSTPLRSVLDMKRHVSPGTLESVSSRIADVYLPLRYDTGVPYEYISSPPDSTGAIRFSFLYSPSVVENIQVRGIKNLSDLSGDTDISIIPVAWHDAIIHIAAFYGFSGLDDTRAATELQIGESRIADMARVYTPDLGRLRVMRPVDASNTVGPVWSLPGNFGPASFR